MADQKLKEYRASERVTDDDQDELAQYQVEFFSITQGAADKSGKKKRRVRTKCPWSVRGH